MDGDHVADHDRIHGRLGKQVIELIDAQARCFAGAAGRDGAFGDQPHDALTLNDRQAVQLLFAHQVDDLADGLLRRDAHRIFCHIISYKHMIILLNMLSECPGSAQAPHRCRSIRYCRSP